MTRELLNLARKLRSNQTFAEQKLWTKIRLKQLGVKFRRQVNIGKYIVDFYCFEKKIVIELDGGQHNHNLNDQQRDDELRNKGNSVIRFWNNDVIENIDGVLEEIKRHL